MRFAEDVVVDNARETVVEVDGPDALRGVFGGGEVGKGKCVEVGPAGAEVGEGCGHGR